MWVNLLSRDHWETLYSDGKDFKVERAMHSYEWPENNLFGTRFFAKRTSYHKIDRMSPWLYNFLRRVATLNCDK